MTSFLDIVTTLCIGLLIGTEFTVSAFINPILNQLDGRAQAGATRLFAKKLGTAMPFWYAASLLLQDQLSPAFVREHYETLARYPAHWPTIARRPPSRAALHAASGPAAATLSRSPRPSRAPTRPRCRTSRGTGSS